jgi:membrane protein
VLTASTGPQQGIFIDVTSTAGPGGPSPAVGDSRTRTTTDYPTGLRPADVEALGVDPTTVIGFSAPSSDGSPNAPTDATVRVPVAASPADLTATVALDRPEPSTHVSSPVMQTTVPWHRPGTGPIPTMEGPVHHRWRKIVGRTLSKAWGDSLFGMSSQAAFWSALSTAPLLLALLGLVGYITHWFPSGTTEQVRTQVFTFLHVIFNSEVADNLVGNTVDTILGNGRSDVVSVGLIISFWAGSSAMSAFVESITIAYGQHEVRHPVAERFFALFLYLVALFAGILLLPLLAIGPDYLPRLFPKDWQATVTTIVNIAYYPVLGIGLILLLATLYKVAPKHKHRWVRGLPGALLAAAVFIVTSFGLRLYLSYVYSHGLTYGALATPITFLLFYYFVAMAIVIGAQFNNATLEYYPPKRSRRELRKWQRYVPSTDPTTTTT